MYCSIYANPLSKYGNEWAKASNKINLPQVHMSSNKKSDNNNDKAEQEALKEAEIVAELAPDEKRSRKISRNGRE